MLTHVVRVRSVKRYEGQVHTTQSYIILLIALVLTIVDFGKGIGRVGSYLKEVYNGQTFSFSNFRASDNGQERRKLANGWARAEAWSRAWSITPKSCMAGPRIQR